MFLIFGIVFGLGGELMSILAYKTKERVEFVAPPKQSLLKDIAMLRYNKILILLLLAQILNFFNGAIAWIYFFKYCVSVNIGGKVINGETVQFYYGILVSAFSAVSMFFAVKLADKLGGMKNMVVLAQVMNAAFRVVAFFIGFDTLPKMIAVIAIISVSSVPTNMVGIAQRALHLRFHRLYRMENRQANRGHIKFHAEFDEQIRRRLKADIQRTCTFGARLRREFGP